MIPQISEINLPSYATLHQATVNLSDMGDKTISADVKIDGAQRPDFVGTDGNDWEIQFRGERYIHPLREPQARKDNASICSVINMTFYHWAIYQMKRYFWVSLANVESGTPIVDKYIASIAVNLPDFARALDDMLAYYLPNREVYVYKQGNSYINPDFDDYDKQTKYIEINHSYIWDVLQKTYELFRCRWSIVLDSQGNYAIKFGYPLNTEIAHKFQYGYDGGLTSVERQVQDDSIRNQLLGRGGEKNLPYMYFKDYERFHPNSDNSAYKNIGLPDPDAIPELENILFTEIRDKNFRSYVQGWKVNIHRQNATDDGWGVSHNAAGTVFTESNGDTYSLDAARMETDWAYAKGATDEKFDPVEYVKDDESIQTFGLLQGGLDDNEDIYPTIQGMEVELPCSKGAHGDFAAGHDVVTLADEVVDVEEVETDVIADQGAIEEKLVSEEISVNGNSSTPGTASYANAQLTVQIDESVHVLKTAPFTVPEGYFGNIILAPKVYASTKANFYYKVYNGSTPASANLNGSVSIPLDATVASWGVYDANTDAKQSTATNLKPGSYYMKVRIMTAAFAKRYGTKDYPNGTSEVIQSFRSFDKMYLSASAVVDNYNFDGEIVANTDQSGFPISLTKTIEAYGTERYTVVGGTFVVPAQGATVVDCPISLDPATGRTFTKTVKILNTDTSEYVINSDIPAGNYRVIVEVDVTNTEPEDKDITVSLQPAHVNYNHEYEDWKPTFDIWIKNIFSSNRADYDTDDEYMRAIWEPLIATQEMTVFFATGNLSRHSDWEFKVNSIAYDNDKTIIVKDEEGVEHEVRSEWRLTLVKSDAEADAIHKYVPYKDFNAHAGDRFVLYNIYLPWAYVYAAEAEVNAAKEKKLDETKNVQPAWVIKFDKVRMLDESYSGIDDLHELMFGISPGDKLWVRDSRFTSEVGVQLYVSSMSYTWQGDGALLPDIEVVLSDKVETALSTVQQIQSDIKVLSNQVRELSSTEQIVRKIGDSIYLRKDGFEDTSYSPTNVAKRLSSQNFRAGIVGGQGWSADTDADGDTFLEIDKLRVRKELHVNNLVINQVTSMGGKEIISAAGMTVSEVRTDPDGFVCYFDTHNGTIGNLFKVDDVALSQVWDEVNNQTKYYKRRVTEVGADYIKLSYTYMDGEGVPAVGDVICQYGNYSDPNRQFVIIRDVVGGGYEQMLSGLISVNSTGSEYYFAGIKGGTAVFRGLSTSGNDPLEDSDGDLLGYNEPVFKPRWYVGDMNTGYAEYLDGTLTVKGQIIVTGGSGLSNMTEWSQVTELQTRMNDWASDGKISPEEKEDLKRFWSGEASDKTAILADLTRYGFSQEYIDDFNDAWSAANTAVTKYTAATPESITIDSTEYPAAIDAYLNVKATAQSEISAVVKLANTLVNGKVDSFNYLKAALGHDTSITQITNALVLSTFIGVKDSNDDVVAAMNASRTLPGWQSGTYGTVMIAAGITNLGDASTPLAATTKIWSSGRIESTDVSLTGSITATGGQIGPFKISTDDIYIFQNPEDYVASSGYGFSSLHPEYYSATMGKVASDGETWSQTSWVRVGPLKTDVTASNYAVISATVTRTSTQAGGNNRTNKGINVSVTGTSMENIGAYITAFEGNKATGIDVSAYSATTSTALNASAWGGTTAVAIKASAYNATTNYAIQITNGSVAGLRPKVRYLTQGSSSTDRLLSDEDFTIVMSNSSAAYLYLPTSPKEGQMYQIYHTSASPLYIYGVYNNEGKQIRSQSAHIYEDMATHDKEGLLFLIYSSGFNAWVISGLWFN